jgi:ABC-2 type transport system permease protein
MIPRSSANSFELFLRTMWARAYPRIVGMKRQPSWIIHEAILPVLSVSAFAYIYRFLQAPEEFIGFVVLGGAMSAFWMNVLWSMGAQLYWERSSANLEIYIMSPASLMAMLAGVALGGIAVTTVRAAVIITSGILIFKIPFHVSHWGLLIFTFGMTLLALYGMGMMFASLFLLWGREARHLVNALEEPIYALSGVNYPLKIFPTFVAAIASVIPLTMGMDALRQLLFASDGFWPLWVEISVLSVLSVVFILLARYFLNYLERKAKESGKITVRWQ